MNGYDASKAAKTIDDYIHHKETDDTAPINVAYSLESISQPDAEGDFFHISVSVFREPIEEFYEEKFKKGTQMSELAEKIRDVSRSLNQYQSQNEHTQKKLRGFCLDLSRRMGAAEWSI